MKSKQERREQEFIAGEMLRTIKNLIAQGKGMEGLRRSAISSCMVRMRELKPKAEHAIRKAEQLPAQGKFSMIRLAATHLSLCVTCNKDLAMEWCRESESYLRRAQ